MACPINDILRQLNELVDGKDLGEFSKILADVNNAYGTKITNETIDAIRNDIAKYDVLRDKLETLEEGTEEYDGVQAELETMKEKVAGYGTTGKSTVATVEANGLENNVQYKRPTILNSIDIQAYAENEYVKTALEGAKKFLSEYVAAIYPAGTERTDANGIKASQVRSKVDRVKRSKIPVNERVEEMNGHVRNTSPGMYLLYNTDNTVNDTVAFAMMKVLMDFMAFRAAGLTEVKTDDEVIKEYKLVIPREPDEGTSEAAKEKYEAEVDELYALIDKLKTGKMLKLVANDLGTSVLNELGLGMSEMISLGNDAKMRASLGEMVLQMGIGLGAIQDYADATNTDVRVAMPNTNAVEVDEVDTGKVLKMVKIGKYDPMVVRDYQQAIESLLGPAKSARHTWHAKALPAIEGRAQIHNGSGYNVATEVQTEALNKLRSTEYRENGTMGVLMEMYGDDADALKAAMGKRSEADIDADTSMGYDSKDAAKARNREIDVIVDSMMEVRDRDGGIFFDWFVTIAGRYNLDSTTVNPQSDKSIARWAVTSVEQGTTVRVDEEKDMKPVYWTIAQAFNGSKVDGVSVDVDKMKIKDAIAVGKKLYAMSDSELMDMVRGDVDHLGHAASAINAIRKMKNADGPVTIDLVAEIDGKTNGFAIRLMQFPISTWEKWAAKVGLLFGRHAKVATMAEIEDEPDTYVTIGTKWKETSKNVEISEGDRELLYGAMDAELLPNVQEGADEKDLNKILRNLAKPPTMTFNYSAEKLSIIRNLTNEIVLGNIDKLLSDKSDAYLKEMAVKYGTTVEEIRESLGKGPIATNSNPFVKAYVKAIQKQYAEPMYEALASELSEYVDLNNVVNPAYRIMYEIVSAKIKKEIDRVGADKMTTADLRKIMGELIDVLPGVMGRDSVSEKDKLVILGRAVETLEKAKMEGMLVRDGKFKNSIVQAVMKSISNPGNSGSVLPTHNQESSIMSRVISKMGILGVHDAIVVGAGKIDEAGSMYNEEFWNANMEFSMMDELVTQLENVAEWAEKEGIGAVTRVITKEGGKAKATEMGVGEILGKLKDIQAKVRERRADMAGREMRVAQMGGMENSGYEAKPKATNGIIKNRAMKKLNAIAEKMYKYNNKEHQAKIDEIFDAERNNDC